jgi:hypothetical protein
MATLYEVAMGTKISEGQTPELDPFGRYTFKLEWIVADKAT